MGGVWLKKLRAWLLAVSLMIRADKALAEARQYCGGKLVVNCLIANQDSVGAIPTFRIK